MFDVRVELNNLIELGYVWTYVLEKVIELHLVVKLFATQVG